MFTSLRPQDASKAYRGRTAALWILAIVLLLLAAMSANAIFNGHFVATRADGLPLDRLPAAAARVIVMFYAVWGVTQLTVVAFGFVALVRHRGLVPLTFLILLVEQVLWRIVHHALPVSRQGGAGGSWFILGLLALTAIGFALSLWKRR